MANTINSFVYTSFVTMTETITSDAPALSAGANSVLSTGFNVTETLGPTTTPPLSIGSEQNYALTSGALTVNLTSLLQTGGGSISLAGKKVCVLKIQNTGSHLQTFAQGGTDPWESAGAAWSMPLYPGEEMTLLLGNTSDAAVSPTVCNIAVTGTGSDTFTMSIGAG
jgi:hypothetical protein